MRNLGTPFTSDETHAFVDAARSYIGVRYRHQGRTRRGVDCGGLVAVSLAAVGRPVADILAYGREPLDGRLEACLATNFGPPLPASELRVGDVALMRFTGAPQHVAIAGDYPHGGLSIIHSYASARKVIEHRLDSRWSSNIVEVYRP